MKGTNVQHEREFSRYFEGINGRTISRAALVRRMNEVDGASPATAYRLIKKAEGRRLILDKASGTISLVDSVPSTEQGPTLVVDPAQHQIDSGDAE